MSGTEKSSSTLGQKAILLRLPNEILQQIISYLSGASIPAIQRSCCRLYSLVDSLTWRRLCQTEFRYWDPDRDVRNKFDTALNQVDWRGIFAERYCTKQRVTSLLDSILSSQVGRIGKFQQIVEMGYDAKDCLLEHLAVDDDTDDVLARRWYSDAVLGCLHRSIAIKEWSDLQRRENVPLERALAAFDMFVLHDRQGDLEETATSLNSIAAQILEEYPLLAERTTRQKASAIVTFLRQRGLTGIIESLGHRYHDLQNNFIGFALHDQSHASLPLISASIFSCIAQRLGVDANPCAFPFHVITVVRPPSGLNLDGHLMGLDAATDSMYLDPFETDQEVPISTLISRLRLVAAPQSGHDIYLSPTPVPELILRTGRNILTSVQESHRSTAGRANELDESSASSFMDLEGAFYGALWASLILGMPANGDGPPIATIRRRTYLPPFIEHFETHFPHDIGLIEKYIIPTFQHSPEFSQLRDSVRIMRSVDSMPKQVKRRTKDISRHVQYKVGQVFTHRKYRYLGVITGWDIECGANEHWMAQMRVHELARGGNQSFYHALVEDKSVRYVAEENINIIRPEVPYPLMNLAGRHFKRWDKKRRCFVSNISDEYPDD